MYSEYNPLTYVLTTTKLDATGHQWIAKLAKFNFTINYCLRKSNVIVNALSRIPWDQNIEVHTIGAIFKATVDGTEILMAVLICHKRVISFLILELSPSSMAAMECVWAQKPDTVLSQVTTLIEDGKLRTMKVSEEMSQEVKQY